MRHKEQHHSLRSLICIQWGCSCSDREWLPAMLCNIFNAKGLFHIVLQPLSTGCVDTILVFSFVQARQNTKPFNYLSPPFFSNTNPYFWLNVVLQQKGKHVPVAFNYNYERIWITMLCLWRGGIKSPENMGNLSNGDHGQGRYWFSSLQRLNVSRNKACQDISCPNTQLRPSSDVTGHISPAAHDTLPPDHLLRGQELPGSELWVRQRLHGPSLVLQPVQLNPGGERLLHDLRATQLHGPPVLHAEGRVSWLPEVDGLQQLYPLVPDDSTGEPVIVCKDNGRLL